jgi:hypothetical protein
MKITNDNIQPGSVKQDSLAPGPVVVNTTNITENITVAANTNALSVGPVTLADGVTVTVTAGQRWIVL